VLSRKGRSIFSNTNLGCGSKVINTEREFDSWALLIKVRISALCPMWTPSKFPITTQLGSAVIVEIELIISVKFASHVPF